MNKLMTALFTLSLSMPSLAGDQSIIGGKKVKTMKYPFIVSLMNRGGDHYNSQFCAGSLIREDIVLTAAHCVVDQNATNLQVSAGRIHLENNIELGQDRFVSRIVVHESYDYYSSDNDIALLYLDEPFELNNRVGLIDSDALPLESQKLTVAGWGNAKMRGTKYPKHLREVDVFHIPRETCNEESWMNGAVTEGMFCAGFEKGLKDSCQGDSGGPIFLKTEDGRYVQEGVVSWGVGCARQNKPGIYTKLSHYIGWLSSQI